MSYTYEYPRPAVTVDCVVFNANFSSKQLEVLLIRRGIEPYKNHLALPGGFVNMDEAIDAAAIRELKEETGFKAKFLEQLYTFGSVDRDPRGRVVSVAYYALAERQEVKGADDAAEAMWIPVEELLKENFPEKLAFDHRTILKTALERLQGKIRYAPIGFNLLPDVFSLRDLQTLYEMVLCKKLHGPNFRKKILDMGFLEVNGTQVNVNHRPAKIFSFNMQKYNEATKNGFNFQI